MARESNGGEGEEEGQSRTGCTRTTSSFRCTSSITGRHFSTRCQLQLRRGQCAACELTLAPP